MDCIVMFNGVIDFDNLNAWDMASILILVSGKLTGSGTPMEESSKAVAAFLLCAATGSLITVGTSEAAKAKFLEAAGHAWEEVKNSTRGMEGG